MSPPISGSDQVGRVLGAGSGDGDAGNLPGLILGGKLKTHNNRVERNMSQQRDIQIDIHHMASKLGPWGLPG